MGTSFTSQPAIRGVKAFVSQVGSMDGRWVITNPQMCLITRSQGAGRTRGTVGYPQPSEKFGTLTGAPVLEKFIGYAPIEDIDRCAACAKLFIIAENEELFDNKDHAILAYERASGVKKLITIPGIKHYGIYNEARETRLKKSSRLVRRTSEISEARNYTRIEAHGKPCVSIRVPPHEPRDLRASRGYPLAGCGTAEETAHVTATYRETSTPHEAPF